MELKYKNNIYDVEISKTDDALSATINNEKIHFFGKTIAPNIFSVSFDNKYVNSYCAADENHYYINIEGNNFTFDKVKEEEKSYGFEDASMADKEIVKPPMPGSIVKVIAEKGQKVSEGDALIIVEAMKMETTLYSSIDGIVMEINAAAGEQVDSDKVLMVIEKE